MPQPKKSTKNTAGGNLVHIHPDEINANLGKHEYEIVLFTATWCGPCQGLKQQGFPAMFQKYADKDLIIYSVDGDECHDAKVNPMDKYGIPGYPTCIFHHHGKIIDKKIQTNEEDDEPSPNGYIIGYGGDKWFVDLVGKIFA